MIYLLSLIINLYCTALLVRALLQLVQADFYNPLSQTVFKVCAPVVEPLRKVFPIVGTFNSAALIAALIIKLVFFLLLGASFGVALVRGSFELLLSLVDIYFWGIFVLVIASWVGTTHHPMVRVVGQVVEPYLRPFRKLIPPIGMIDISPMVAILLLMVIREKLLPQLWLYISPVLG